MYLKKAQNYVQDSVELPYNMAVVYRAQGRFDDAIQTLQQLVRNTEKPEGVFSPGERTNRAVFLERLGTIYRDTGKYELAAGTFRKMLELGEDNQSRGYQEMIDTYRDAKMWPQATAAAEGALKVPNDRNLKLTLAAQLADTGQPDQAIASAKLLLANTPPRTAKSTSRLPKWPPAQAVQGVGGVYREGVAARSQTRRAAVCRFVWGSINEKQKKYQEAEEMFKKALANDGRNTTVLNYLGYMLADRGVRLQEALGYIKKAVELEPQNGAYLDSLGWAYFKLGDYNMAEDNLRRASKPWLAIPPVQDHLGELYAKTGRLQLAASHWERAITEWNKSTRPMSTKMTCSGCRRSRNPPASNWRASR